MEPNPQFTITRTLRPCRVTKSLLLDLERSISATLADIAGDSDKPRKVTTLTITDADGEEVLKSAELIGGDQLPNSTNQVQLSMSVETRGDEKASVALTVRLVFKSSVRPVLRIVFVCPRARDQAVGMEGRVMRLMENSFDHSRFFHPSSTGSAIAFTLAVAGGFLWLVATLNLLGKADSKFSSGLYFWLTAVPFTAVAYVFVCARYYPDTAFDTKRRAELDEQKGWAKKALWSLIGINLIAGTLLEKLKAYFGF
ncbi:MAG TPA: hypothetical protein VJQ52_18715 [Steroidobacteraceae bacterium]|nr:hypothetical protein [Steroidobacteraceae bacterium]